MTRRSRSSPCPACDPSPTARRRCPGAPCGAPWRASPASTCSSPTASILTAEDHAPGAPASRLRSTGRPAVTAEIRIAGADDRDLPTSEIGQTLVRGPMVMLGYWRRPELSRETLRDGWMHTGDTGRLDEDGYLSIVDRIKDIIITGGENVYSVEVENPLCAHPAVAQCAVIGIPDDRCGERVHAVIVTTPGQGGR